MTIDPGTRSGAGRTTAAAGRQPAEGRDDLGIPGADHGLPDAPPGGGSVDEEQRREALGERARSGRPVAAGGGEADVLPDVEVPECQM